MPSIADRLHTINENRLSTIRSLAPNLTDYLLGGAHRLWIKDCATRVAEKSIAEYEETYRANGDFVFVVLHYLIPMPPQWNGVRPPHITETDGHPHLANKDWRHFENTLRWRLAEKGYICTTKMTHDYEGIAFYAIKMLDAARWGDELPPVFIDTTKIAVAVPSSYLSPYDEMCKEVDEHMAKDDEMVRRRAVLEVLPFSVRPLVALTM